MKGITVDTLRVMAQVGGLAKVEVVTSAQGIGIRINDTLFLAGQRKESRIFRSVDTALALLASLGVTTVHRVDLANWGAWRDKEKSNEGG